MTIDAIIISAENTFDAEAALAMFSHMLNTIPHPHTVYSIGYKSDCSKLMDISKPDFIQHIYRWSHQELHLATATAPIESPPLQKYANIILSQHLALTNPSDVLKHYYALAEHMINKKVLNR